MSAPSALISRPIVRAAEAGVRLAVRVALVLAYAAVVWVALVGAADATSWQKCSGAVKLPQGERALHLSALRVSCREARRVIKAPASKVGYRCTNPFDDPQGSGGWVTCRKGKRAIRFLYEQS